MTTTTTKQRRTRKACVRCRKQKLKCDNARPCVLCQRAEVPCEERKPNAPNEQSKSPSQKKQRTSEFLFDQGPSIQNETPVSDMRSVPCSLDALRSFSSTDNEIQSTIHSAAIGDKVSPNSLPVSFNTSLSNHSSTSLDPSVGTAVRKGSDTQIHSIRNRIPLSPHSIQTSNSDCTTESPEVHAESTTVKPSSVLELTERVLRINHVDTLFRSEPSFSMIGGIPASETGLVPLSEFLGDPVPPRQLLDALVDTFFASVNWLMNVMVESRFRQRYCILMSSNYVDRNTQAFAMLVSSMMLISARVATPTTRNQFPDVEFGVLESKFLKLTSSKFLDVIQLEKLEAVQYGIIYATYQLYYRTPSLAWSIIGATLKVAVACRLHVEPPATLAPVLKDERRRCWLSLYVTDRYSCMAYGCPVGISDRDISVTWCLFDTDIEDENNHNATGEPNPLNVYYVKKYELYQISSEILENIYNRDKVEIVSLQQTLADLYRKLQVFYESIPDYLSLERVGDLTPDADYVTKILRLQALALQMAFENIQVMLLRPFLAVKAARAQMRSGLATSPNPAVNNNTAVNTAVDSIVLTSTRQCVHSALRTSRMIDYPVLLNAALMTHAASFFSHHIFTSGVVLCMSIIMDPLSEDMYDIKMGIQKNIAIQKQMSDNGKVSQQSLDILIELTKMAFSREMATVIQERQLEDSEFPSTTWNPYQSEGLVNLLNEVPEEIFQSSLPPETWLKDLEELAASEFH